MEKIYRLIWFFVLLTTTTVAWAQNSGKLEYNGCKMTYSVSGGTIVRQGDSHAGVQRTLTCEVKTGNTITFTCTGTGVNNRKCHFKMVATTGKSENEGIVLESKKINEQTVTYSYTIPRDARYVRLQATYDTNSSREGRSKPLSIAVNCSIVEGTSTAGPVAVREEDPCDCRDGWFDGGSLKDWSPKYSMYKDCGIRFKDITGDVSVRHCDEDDDSYESAEFDTILHYCDRVKTEVESEAVLGLADKTAFYLKEKSVLIMPPYEGDISYVKMLAGVIWLNMKRPWNGQELRLEGTQAVLGIRGTIVAMEETGKETKFWLLAGKVDVTSKKTGKKVVLEAGQMTITGKDGQTKIQKFNIEQAAKRFKIPMDEIRNHYSDTGSTGNTSVLFTADKLNYKVLTATTVEVTGELRGTYKGSVKIPAQVKHQGKTYQVVGIGSNAFANQSQMTSITIPTSVRSIAGDAFANSGLTSVTVPGDKVSIAANAFRNCTKLLTATVSGKNPQCQGDAFTGCSSMKELRIRDIKESNYGKTLPGTTAVIKKIQ